MLFLKSVERENLLLSLITLGTGKNSDNFSTTAIGPAPGPPPP